MKRRVLIVTGILSALVGVPAAASALPAQGAGTGDWACAIVRPADVGVCVDNPIPHPLPTVSLPAPQP